MYSLKTYIYHVSSVVCFFFFNRKVYFHRLHSHRCYWTETSETIVIKGELIIFYSIECRIIICFCQVTNLMAKVSIATLLSFTVIYESKTQLWQHICFWLPRSDCSFFERNAQRIIRCIGNGFTHQEKWVAFHTTVA
jgi:hypothetical protein